MIPRLEQLETREAPAAVAVDPVFAAGVIKLETALLNIYTPVLQTARQLEAAGVHPAGGQQGLQDVYNFILSLPSQMYAWYQAATPADIALADAGFIELGRLGLL